MQEISRVVVVWDKVCISLFHSRIQCGMLDETVVHKKVLLATALAGIFGLGYKTVDLHHVGILIHRVEPFLVVLAVHLVDSLGKITPMQVVQQLSIMVESIVDMVVDKCHTLKYLLYMAQLNTILFEEVASCRNIIEEVLHCNIGATLATARTLLLDVAPLDNHLCAQLAVVPDS